MKQRQLTPEALRFIQLNPGPVPDGFDEYESAETIVDTGRPFYTMESAQTIVDAERPFYVVPDPPAEEPVDVLDRWLKRDEAEAAAVVPLPSLWQRLLSRIRLALRRG